MSPNFDLGQWRSAAPCEVSLRHKVWATVDASLQPLYRYLQSQRWMCGPIKDAAPDRVRRGAEHEPFRLAQFQGEVMTGSCQPNAASLTQAIPMQRILELSTKLANLPLDPPASDRDRVNKERDEIQRELTSIGRGINEQEQFAFEVTVNEPSSADRPIPIGSGTVEKIGPTEYVVASVGLPASGYNDVGGTYVLIGQWQPPELAANQVRLRPALSASGKPLSVQAVLIRLGAGPDLARQALQRLDVRALAAMLTIVP